MKIENGALLDVMEEVGRKNRMAGSTSMTVENDGQRSMAMIVKVNTDDTMNEMMSEIWNEVKTHRGNWV